MVKRNAGQKRERAGRFEVELTEDERTKLGALAAEYSKALGIVVSRGSALKLLLREKELLPG